MFCQGKYFEERRLLQLLLQLQKENTILDITLNELHTKMIEDDDGRSVMFSISCKVSIVGVCAIPFMNNVLK